MLEQFQAHKQLPFCFAIEAMKKLLFDYRESLPQRDYTANYRFGPRVLDFIDGTYHSAKGLEFDTVVLPFLSAHRLPHPPDVFAFGEDEAASQDSKLLYVGVTRAKANLILTISQPQDSTAAVRRVILRAEQPLTSEIRDDAHNRGITRVCHFTPARNVGHILTGTSGVLASTHLRSDEREVFNPTDVVRLDGFPDHVSCSIEYPNGWYFPQSESQGAVVRGLGGAVNKTRPVMESGNQVPNRNAAARRGAGVSEGLVAYQAMFASRVVGAYGQMFVRGPKHPDWLPTDEQAEVLIPDAVDLKEIMGVAVSSMNQAKRESARMRLLQRSSPPVFIAPVLFDASRLSVMIRQGQRPEEVEYQSGNQ